MRWRIAYAIVGFYFIGNALEELLLRWADDVLGREEVLGVFRDHLNALADRPSWLPWLLLIIGAVLFYMQFKKPKNEVENDNSKYF